MDENIVASNMGMNNYHHGAGGYDQTMGDDEEI